MYPESFSSLQQEILCAIKWVEFFIFLLVKWVEEMSIICRDWLMQLTRFFAPHGDMLSTSRICCVKRFGRLFFFFLGGAGGGVRRETKVVGSVTFLTVQRFGISFLFLIIKYDHIYPIITCQVLLFLSMFHGMNLGFDSLFVCTNFFLYLLYFM